MKLSPVAPLVLALAAVPAAGQQPALEARVDSIFARLTGPQSPGCAVAASRAGQPVLSRAYGMANLEHDQPNRPETVFEAGSVSKQFTAAAVVLLAQDGALSLDDDVRRHVPELPDYGEVITLRHLLNHTSGLRDWGSVAAVGGWPRGSRTYTHRHVLDIAGRQRALNHRPGEHYSYTNTGYNLLAIVAERVSGMPLAELTRTRLFEPLGMTSTGWRDDYTRIVKGRAVAYRPAPGGFRMSMPFENVYGNSSLLTTVADLLRWNENLRTGRVGGQAFVDEMHRQARLNGGRQIEYASGLMVTRYRGHAEVSHGGATAGYRAFLARYPEAGVDVALLCNAGQANPSALAHQVADLLLPAGGDDADAAPPAEVPAEVLGALAGTYRDTRTSQPLRLVFLGGRLAVDGGPPLVPLSPTRFHVGSRFVFAFDAAAGEGGRRGFDFIFPDGDTVRHEAMEEWAPGEAELGAFAGRFHSQDAEVSFTLEVREGALVLVDRYDNPMRLRPVYRDAFAGGPGLFRFSRDEAGRVVRMHVVNDRVWDLPFDREP